MTIFQITHRVLVTMEKSIYFDLLLDYSVDHAQVKNQVKELVKEKYLGYNVYINIDTKFI